MIYVLKISTFKLCETRAEDRFPLHLSVYPTPLTFLAECTFSNILTCVHLPVGGHNLVGFVFALTFKYRIELQGYLLFVDHFNELRYFSLNSPR